MLAVMMAMTGAPSQLIADIGTQRAELDDLSGQWGGY